MKRAQRAKTSARPQILRVCHAVQPALHADAARCTTSAEEGGLPLGSHGHEEMNPHERCLFFPSTRTLQVMANLFSEESQVLRVEIKRGDPCGVGRLCGVTCFASERKL